MRRHLFLRFRLLMEARSFTRNRRVAAITALRHVTHILTILANALCHLVLIKLESTVCHRLLVVVDSPLVWCLMSDRRLWSHHGPALEGLAGRVQSLIGSQLRLADGGWREKTSAVLSGLVL